MLAANPARVWADNDRVPRYAHPFVKRCVPLLACIAASLSSAAVAQAHHWQRGACGLPSTLPLYAEFAEVSVSPVIRREIFGPARPPLVLASSGNVVPLELRTLGAHTVYWEMKLQRMVGNTRTPTDPASIAEAAGRLAVRAATQSGCSTPLIALNELQGAWLSTPWSPTNAQYRANVLALMAELDARGAHPYLLVPTKPKPFTASAEAAFWWQQLSAVSDLVLQVHFDGRYISRRGAVIGSRKRRIAMRRVLTQFHAIGVPPDRLGLLHGFQSGRGFGGREGLRLREWLRVVKWETLAAKQVAAERAASGAPVGSDWSWGWGDFPDLTPTSVDPQKPITACVYLWARDTALCNGPERASGQGASFNSSLTEGQIMLPPTVHCALGRGDAINTETLAQLGDVTGEPGQLGRRGALTVLLEWVIDARHAKAEAEDVLRIEQGIVAGAFGGDRAAYETALGERHTTLTLARALIADQLRRAKIVRSLPLGLTYERWMRVKQAETLRTAVCQVDELPDAGVVDLSSYLPFLRI
jgi:hypothetical protein